MTEYLYLFATPALLIIGGVLNEFFAFTEDAPGSERRKLTRVGKVAIPAILLLIVISAVLQFLQQKSTGRFDEGTRQQLSSIKDAVEDVKLNSADANVTLEKVLDLLELQREILTPEERHRLAALVDDPAVIAVGQHDLGTRQALSNSQERFAQIRENLRVRSEALHERITNARRDEGKMDSMDVPRLLEQLEEEIHLIRVEVSYLPSSVGPDQLLKELDSALQRLGSLWANSRLLASGIRVSARVATSGDVVNMWEIEGDISGVLNGANLWAGFIDDDPDWLRPSSELQVRIDGTWNARLHFLGVGLGSNHDIGVFLVDTDTHATIKASLQKNATKTRIRWTECCILLDRFSIGRVVASEGEDVFTVSQHELTRR